MPLGIHSIYRNIFKLWRKRRFSLFLRLLQPQPNDSLIDVGGYPWFWLDHPQPVGSILTVNVNAVTWDGHEAPDHNIQAAVGDGCRLEAADASYDIGFSNSVIEHVGSWESQQAFAREIRRVGKSLWVQTPAYECPIEPHYLAPCVQYLPRWLQKKTVRWLTPWGWLVKPDREQVEQMVETTRLISKREMRQLFPDCEIVTERMLWLLPKSYIAVRHGRHKSSTGGQPDSDA